MPQDKVASFAKLEPDKLLHATMRAAGTTGETEQETIAKEQIEINLKTTNYNLAHEQLQNLRDKNARLERDVHKLQEQEKIENEIDAVKAKIVFAKYQSHVDMFVAQKETVNNLLAQINIAEEPLEPLKIQRDRAKEALDASNQKELMISRKSKQLKAASSVSELENTIETREIRAEAVENFKKKEKQRIKDISDAEARVEREESKLETLSKLLMDKGILSADKVISSSISAKIQRELDKTQMEIDAFEQYAQEIGGKLQDLKGELRSIDISGSRTQGELESQDNIRTQRMNLLRNINRDVHDAVLWIRDHESVFKGRVYEPVILEMSIKEKKYANLVEGSIPYAMLTVIFDN